MKINKKVYSLILVFGYILMVFVRRTLGRSVDVFGGEILLPLFLAVLYLVCLEIIREVEGGEIELMNDKELEEKIEKAQSWCDGLFISNYNAYLDKQYKIATIYKKRAKRLQKAIENIKAGKCSQVDKIVFDKAVLSSTFRYSNY